MRRITGLLLGLLALSWPVVPAQARWTTSATGTAAALSASLAPPTSLVASCGLLRASVKLDWVASGSAWTDGYEVRWGTSPGVYASSATTTLLTYTTPALALGTYYFTVRATSGQWRSANAAEVSKVIVSLAGLGTCI